MMSKVPRKDNNLDFIDLSDIPDVSPDSENPDARAVYEADQALKKYLWSLPIETIADITTLMCMGADHDYDESLEGEQRFLDYWAYLSDSSLFNDGKEDLIDYITSKSPLPEYLRDGLAAIS